MFAVADANRDGRVSLAEATGRGAAAFRPGRHQPRRPHHARGARSRCASSGCRCAGRRAPAKPPTFGKIDIRARLACAGPFFVQGARRPSQEYPCLAARRLPLLAVALSLSLPLSAARADEGMWTFDAFPAAKMQRRLRLGARPGMARQGARLGGPADRRLLGQLRLARGPDPHQPPLRRDLRRAELRPRRTIFSPTASPPAPAPRSSNAPASRPKS